jgi:hypothetical protein
MTTTISDQRTILTECDANDWTTGIDGVNTDVAAAEATACLGMVVSTETQEAYETITSDDWSAGGTFSLWARAYGAMDNTTNGGIQMVVGDGTDRDGWHVGGSDVTGFRHFDGPVEWANFVLDPLSLPANSTNYAGTAGQVTFSTVTQVGVSFKTLAKSVGGSQNCQVDILRWADIGIGVTFRGGTTSGAAGNMAEGATEDRSTLTQRAHGVVHELAAGVYGIQGNVILGDSGNTSDQYWTESNVTYAWEDRGLSDVNYYRLLLVGNSTATNCNFSFTACSFTCPSGAYLRFDGNGADIDVCTITNSTFSGVNVGIVGSDDTGDDWTGNAYINSGVLEINGCDHSGSTFSGGLEAALTESQDETSYDDTTTEGTFEAGSGYAASDTITLDNGALITVDTVSTGAITTFTVTTSAGYPANEGQLLEQASTSGSGTGFTLTPRSANLTEGGSVFYDVNADPDGELDNCSFTKGTDATHAIVFGPNVPATMTLRGIDFSGYNGTDEQTDSTLHFLDTTGTITVNLIDCTGNISSKSEGATINLVISPVTTKVTAEDQGGNMLENVRVFLETADNGGGSGLPYQAATSTLTQTGGTATLTASAAHGLATNDYVVVRGANDELYNKVAQITVTSTTVFTYSVDSGASASAGGTPVFSYVPLSGLTDSNGVIQSSKSWPASQSLSGWARKSTGPGTLYKQSPISVADASGGTDLLLLMIEDE